MKKSMKIFSFFMAALMFVMALPITAFAAKRETYIKEIRISTAATDDEAKQWLIDNDYIVLDANLNQKTGKDCVYIGYKTTTNPDEAITDISLMQMDGGYSFSEYEAMIERKKVELASIIASFAASITEARANYAAGQTGALAAYKIFDRFVEDDSGKSLAELFFGATDPDTKVLEKIFLQGNSAISGIVYNGLALACTDNGETTSWLAKLATQDPYGEYDELLYSDVADDMFDSFEEINKALGEYIEKGKPIVDSLELTDDMSLEEANDVIPTEYAQEMMLYDTLSDYTYNGKSLLEFFLQDPNEIDTEEFYPLLDAMSVGQRAILKFVGLRDLISFAAGNASGIEYYETLLLSVFGDMKIEEKVSVYYGVDRSLFDGGVALTNASLRKSASTGDRSWYSEKNLNPTVSIALRTIQGVSGLTMIAMPIWRKMAGSTAKKEATALAKSTLETLQDLHNMVDTIGDTNSVYTALMKGYLDNPSQKAVAEAITKQADDAGRALLNSAYSKITTIYNAVMGVAAGIMLIAEGIAIGIKVYNYYHPEYSEIPRIIVDEVVTDTDSYYVNYYAVKDHTGEFGDLNAWSAQRWNALYTTTDKKAGDPIIASSLIVKLKDSAFPSDEHGAVHYFGETAAANVNRYQFKKTAPATYIFYERDHSLSMTASTFSGGQLMMFTGFGMLGGVAIGSLGVIGAGKMKKKKETADSVAEA